MDDIFEFFYRITYRLAAEKVAYFFSCIMDGTTFISKSYASHVSKSTFLGLPLTVDILIEIICFGLTSSESTVRVCNLETNSFGAETQLFILQTDFIKCGKDSDINFAE